MSTNDIRIVDTVIPGSIPSRTYQVASGTTASIHVGEPVMLTTIGTSQYAVLCVDAQPAIGTDYFVGIAATASTETSSAAGTVSVYMPLPGIVYRAVAESATAANTDAKISALANKRSTFALNSSVFTIGTGDADGSTNGIMLTGTGDSSKNQVDFVVSARATILAA